MKKNIYLPAIFFMVCLINFAGIKLAAADIYMRVGKNGTIYFSNVPVSGNYRLYMRTKHRPNSPKLSRGVLYKKIILRASNKYGVSPKLIEAVIQEESGFNKDAVSNKGAEGLMQLMPQIQRRLDISKPFNPVQNIYGGTKYLKSLITMYNGDIPLALAAYNAGTRAVKKYGGIPPYKETGNYVNEIMNHYEENNKNAK